MRLCESFIKYYLVLSINLAFALSLTESILAGIDLISESPFLPLYPLGIYGAGEIKVSLGTRRSLALIMIPPSGSFGANTQTVTASPSNTLDSTKSLIVEPRCACSSLNGLAPYQNTKS